MSLVKVIESTYDAMVLAGRSRIDINFTSEPGGGAYLLTLVGPTYAVNASCLHLETPENKRLLWSKAAGPYPDLPRKGPLADQIKEFLLIQALLCLSSAHKTAGRLAAHLALSIQGDQDETRPDET